MQRWLRTPSPATAMSAVALFVSLGGVGYAAATGSIDSREIKNNTVSSSDIRNRTIVSRDLSRRTVSSLRGLQGATGPAGRAGPTGAPGPAGAPGSALAFAHVNANVTLDSANSKNVTLLPLLGGPGVFCLDVTAAQRPQNVVATLETAGSPASVTDQIRATLTPGTVAFNCGPPADTLVETTNAAGSGVDRAFYVVIN